MGKRITIGLTILFVVFGVLWLIKYLAIFNFTVPTSQRIDSYTASGSNSPKQSVVSTHATVPYKIEVVAENLTVPWSIVFPDNTRILVSERTGSIIEIKNGVVSAAPLYTFADTARSGEIGLMGLTLDPDYLVNKLLYACVGYRTDKGYADRVVVLKDNGERLTPLKTLLEGIPAASNHAGCELAFGPDGKLYISTGDATERNIAQNLDSLGGKILRMNTDGSIPSDNPFSNSLVYSYGHRNPQGIDWTADGKLYQAEHGPSGNDGPGGGDEVNLIKPGANYGWPLVSHDRTQDGTEAPIITYTPAEAPSSLLIYKGDVFPQLKGSILMAALRGQGIIQLVVDLNNPEQVISSDKLSDISVGRIRDITQGPDGLIYFTTSNTDGRGQPNTGDDKIYRLSPI